MFVLCEKCRNHYDDSCQEESCEASYSIEYSTRSAMGRHRTIRTSPLADHVAAVTTPPRKAVTPDGADLSLA